LEYAGIKSTANEPAHQGNSAAQDRAQQAGPSNVLALPGALLV